MAEIAAGAYVAAEAIEHTVEAGYAAYIVSKPTLPLKVKFTRIATVSGDASSRSLARSNHSVTIIGNKAYIFGGKTANNQLATNDIHAVTIEHSHKPEMDYSLIPALSTSKDGRTPPARTNHAACAFHGNVAVYGGCSQGDERLEETSAVWLFSPERKAWDALTPSSVENTPGPRQDAKLFVDRDSIILYGGVDSSGDYASDLWKFNVASRIWTQLPTAPVSTSNATLTKGQLWLISGSDPISGKLHHLSISTHGEEGSTWESFSFPTNPLAPGPRARNNGALLPLTTGWGRNYLIYLLGAKYHSEKDSTTTNPEDVTQEKDVTQFSDAWAIQIPSSDLEPKPALSLKEAIKPAKIKDAIRHALGAETGHLQWAEAIVQPLSDKELNETDGKLHPGPRAFFGADVTEHGDEIVFWGGIDARGERAGDGWIVKFQ